jgi:hypothetical protein
MATPSISTIERLNTPAELTTLPQWVVTKLVHGFDKNGNPKTDKPPFHLSSDGRRLFKASHSNPAHWTTYAAARAIVEAGIDGAEAVGFVFSDADDYTGVDFDGCRDPHTAEIAEWAAYWIRKLNSYTEISKSETGVKVWVKGKLPKELKLRLGEHKGIEVYSRKRFFWMTGSRLEGTPETINDAQAVLDEMALAFDPPKPKPAPKTTTVRRITPGEHAAERLSLADARERFNDQHSLESLLAEYSAEEIRPGYYSCPFCTHTHEITLYISAQGRLFSLSPHCTLATDRGWDAFGLYVKVEHKDDIRAALRTLNPPPAARPTHQAEAPEYLTAQHAQRRRVDAQRHRQNRRAAADELRAEVEARMAADAELTDSDRAVLCALLTIAGPRGWCRPSKPRIAEVSGIPLGTVKRSLMRLEGRYFTSEGDGGGSNCTAVRTFLRGSSALAAEREMIHESYKNTCSEEIQRACERRAPSPALGDTPETWSWSDPPIGAADLAEPLPATELGDAARLRYALLLIAELPGPHPEPETLSLAELDRLIETAERALRAAQEPADDGALRGPDGAVAFPDGAAWLPTDAARAWWEALPKAPRPAPLVLPEPAPEPEPPPVHLGPPSDPAKREQYGKLLGRAKKPGTSPEQAAVLRRLAYAMREPQPAGLAPAAVAAPRSPAPPAVQQPATLPLFADLDVPTQPAWARLRAMGG